MKISENSRTKRSIKSSCDFCKRSITRGGLRPIHFDIFPRLAFKQMPANSRTKIVCPALVQRLERWVLRIDFHSANGVFLESLVRRMKYPHVESIHIIFSFCFSDVESATALKFTPITLFRIGRAARGTELFADSDRASAIRARPHFESIHIRQV